MVKLFIGNMTSSTSVIIAFEELGIAYTPMMAKFDDQDPVTVELQKANPCGAVPTLITEEGKPLSQTLAILEYYCDLKKNTTLLPPPGTYERALVMQWLSFSVTDFHASLLPLFAIAFEAYTHEQTISEVKKVAVNRIDQYYKVIDQSLTGKDFITGNNFTVADCDLFLILAWSVDFLKVPVDSYKNIQSYRARISARPTVQKALKVATGATG